MLAGKEQEIGAKERAVSDERQRVSSLTEECTTLGSKLQNTARWWPSTVGYKRWMLVVGGYGERCVEILDTAHQTVAHSNSTTS